MKKSSEIGITLITLAVTITVIMILSVVTVTAVLGDNGIIARAKKSKTSFENLSSSIDKKMDILVNEMSDDDTNGGGSGGGSDTPTNPTAGTTVAKPGTWTSSQVTPIADGNGGTVPLPNGFYYIGGDYDTGLVISSKQSDTLTSSGTSMGNNFVWIPVSSEEDLTRTSFDSNGQPTSGLYAGYQEPCTSGYDTEAEEYNTMKTQVLKYGGFYIGRFEAGVNTTTLRTKVTSNQTVVCKKGVAPYNYVAWSKSNNDINSAFVATNETSNPDQISSNGAIYLAKNMYSSSSSVTSTLTYGCQWDAMCRYIGDSQRTTPKKSSVELTGSVSTDVSKNIYDLAGNCTELSMEAPNANYRFYRAGFTNMEYEVNRRTYSSLPDGATFANGFRVALYIK